MQIVIVLAALAIIATSIKFVSWNKSYIDKGMTSTINGFFITLVFLSHFSQYTTWGRNYIGYLLGQLIVVMFLFYSGYGCAMQYMSKGEAYLKTFLKKRVLLTLLNFDIAVTVFIVVGLLIGKSFSARQIVFSFVCWDSVGNSNWYIFAIILCYIAFYLSYAMKGLKCANLARYGGVAILLTILFGIVICLSRVKESYWYDTIMAFGAGVMYAIHKEEIEAFARKYYWITLSVLLIAFGAIPHLPIIARYHFVMFNLKSVMFALLIVMVTMKFELRCPVFSWCGRNIFPLYIYQRIPMIVFSAIWPVAFTNWHSCVYLCLSAAITACIAVIYQKCHC